MKLGGRRGATIQERLWDRCTETESGCVEWVMNRLPQGYGRIRVDKVDWYTHRLAWVETHGPIPDGMYVLHKCDNPPCCNPDHLYLGTQRENIHDIINRGRFKTHNSVKTHCKYGHEFSPENTIVNPLNGYRSCKACKSTRGKRKPK